MLFARFISHISSSLLVSRFVIVYNIIFSVERPFLFSTCLFRVTFIVDDTWNHLETGEEEGFYAWVAANHALGTLGGEPQETTGIVELGGPSLQVIIHGALLTTRLILLTYKCMVCGVSIHGGSVISLDSYLQAR